MQHIVYTCNLQCNITDERKIKEVKDLIDKTHIKIIEQKTDKIKHFLVNS